jgi:short-subunit dehydrogenase
MRPGNSRNSFQKRFARASDRCGHRRRNGHFGKLDIVFASAGIAGRTPTGATDEAAAYAATKGGVVSMARAIAADFAPRNIRVNVVAPGATKTPIWKRGSRSAEQSAKLADLFSSTVPLGRWGEAEELAKAVLFLASEDSSYVNAVELVVDGGLTGAPFGAPMLRG